jgi:mono/diheme cytochrome c family protein
VTKDDEWLLAHMADPVAIAPGVRGEDDPAPAPQVTRMQGQAVLAYLRRIRGGARPLHNISAEDRLAAGTFSAMCVACHKIAGEGGSSGPDLSKVGSRRDVTSLRALIMDPTSEYPETIMPRFRDRLNAEQINSLAQYLAKRR